MADDQNQSNNRRAPNSLSDTIDESHLLTELERIGARAGRRTAQRAGLEERIRGEGKLLNKLIEEGERTPIIREGPFYDEQVSSLRGSIRSTRGRMNSLEIGAQARAESEASTAISRQFTPAHVSSTVTNLQRQSAIQNRAFGMAGQSYDDLSARREELLANIRTTERNTLNEVKGMYSRTGQVDPEKSAAMTAALSVTRGHMQEIASINVAQNMQKMVGADPTSKLNKVVAMGEIATIAQELKSGGVNISTNGATRNVAAGDINKEAVEQSRILADALRELSNSVGKTDEQLATLRKTAEESAENLDRLQKAGGMGGGGYSGSQIASAAAGMFGAVGGAIQQIGVGQRLQQVANISGYAGIENQKYAMYGGARGGDVMSQMLLSQWGSAEGFGKQLKTAQQAAVGAYAAGGAAQAAAGGFQISEAGAQKANPLAYATGASTQNTAAALQGAQNIVQGGAVAATNTMDLVRGGTTNAAAIQGTQAQMEARRALLQVSATQLQSFRDLSVGAGVVAQGMGAAGGAFVNQAMSAEGIQQMVGARMSPEQFNQMSQMGVQNMGSMFNSNQVFAARGLERSGFGSMQDNMSRMAVLAQAGSNNPQGGLANIIEMAMAKGLDSSKALNLVAENTAMMAQGTTGAAMGMDVTGISAAMLTTAVDPNNPNREFAIQRAAQASELARGIETNTSTSFAGFMNTARLGQMTGLSGTESIIMQNMDAATIKSIRAEKDPTKQAALLREQGISVPKGKTPNDLLDQTLDVKAMALAEAGGAGLATGVKVTPALIKKIREGTLDDQSAEYQSLAQGAALKGFKGGAPELMRQIRSLYAETPANTSKADEAMKGEGGSDVVKQLDTLRTSGFKQLSEQALQATKAMQDFGGALKVLVDMNEKLEKFGEEGGEAKFATAAKDSAESFGKSTILFDKSVTRFEAAISKIANQAGLGDTEILPTTPTNLRRRGGPSEE